MCPAPSQSHGTIQQSPELGLAGQAPLAAAGLAAELLGCRAALFCSTHICCQQLLTVINAGNADFSLAHIEEVVGVGGDKEEICRYVGHL